MDFDPVNFKAIILDKPLKSVLGFNQEIALSFSNTSPPLTATIYNLTVELTIPDGVSYVSSTIAADSVQINTSFAQTIRWLNITDLAPNQINYEFQVTLHSDEVYRRTQLPVMFDIPLSPVLLVSSVDTKPRGSNDEDNKTITCTDESTFTPARYSITKQTAGKMPKGAGLPDMSLPPMYPFDYTLILANNTISDSTISLVDNLPNGVRFLGPVITIGKDKDHLLLPNVIGPNSTQDFVTLDWGMRTLSANSVNTLTFKVAVYDNYTSNGIENSGDRIPHLTPLKNIATLDGLSGVVSASAITNAMDIIIDKIVLEKTTDVNQVLNYSLTYRVNQYDDIYDVVINDLLDGGQQYQNDATTQPESVINNLDGTTSIRWISGNLNTGASGSITFTTVVSPDFIYSPVSADDNIKNFCNINGINANYSTQTPDSSSTTCQIPLPTINKTINGYYYKDGSKKPFNIGAPGDFVDFTISYSSDNIVAKQLDIQIDEYAPLELEPLTDKLLFNYSGNYPEPYPSPIEVSPDGLRWDLGVVNGNTTWYANTRLGIVANTTKAAKNNLAKLAGYNNQDLAYSARAVVPINFGQPDITFIKTVNPSTVPVSPSDILTFTINLTNNSSMYTTDAFNMTITDIIPVGMNYISNSLRAQGTGLYGIPIITDNRNISLSVMHLSPGDTVILTYMVQIASGLACSTTMTNQAIASVPYAQSDGTYPYSVGPYTSSITTTVIPVILSKTGSATTAHVGDRISYTITVIVPKGTVAYSPQVQDVLPAEQIYFGNATKKINDQPATPVTPTVSQDLKTITFDKEATINAIDSNYTIQYTFSTKVIDGNNIVPYTQKQINSSTISWALTSTGAHTQLETAIFEIMVLTPHITLKKEQRNYTMGSEYTTTPISIQADDIVYYKLSIISDGASDAYDVSLQDSIDKDLVFVSIITPPTVGTINPPIYPQTNLLYTADILTTGTTQIIEFAIRSSKKPAAGEEISNNALSIYKSNAAGFKNYQSSSNTVLLTTTLLSVIKSATKSTVTVGKSITYFITLTIPPKEVAYNVTVQDVLPQGQRYYGNATRNFRNVKTVVMDNVVTFPVENILGPYENGRNIVYSFTAIVETAIAPYPNQQINNTAVTWDIGPEGPKAPTIHSDFTALVYPQEISRGIPLNLMS